MSLIFIYEERDRAAKKDWIEISSWREGGGEKDFIGLNPFLKFSSLSQYLMSYFLNKFANLCIWYSFCMARKKMYIFLGFMGKIFFNLISLKKTATRFWRTRASSLKSWQKWKSKKIYCSRLTRSEIILIKTSSLQVATCHSHNYISSNYHRTRRERERRVLNEWGYTT